MSDTDVLWQRHEELREKVDALNARMSAHDERYNAVVEKLDLSREERKEQFNAIMVEMKAVREEVAEKRGAAKFGAWLAGIMIALGVPAALFSWYTHR